MVYFMQSPDGGAVKIGSSEDVEQRRVQLQAKYGCDLVVLATMPGGKEEEKGVHARFPHLRFGRTEQFAPAPELFHFMGRPLLSPATLGGVEAMLNAEGYKDIIVTLRGTPEFKEFIERYAKRDRLSVADFVERAIVRYAKELGAEEEIPER